jgi:hypothetical protein
MKTWFSLDVLSISKEAPIINSSSFTLNGQELFNTTVASNSVEITQPGTGHVEVHTEMGPFVFPIAIKNVNGKYQIDYAVPNHSRPAMAPIVKVQQAAGDIEFKMQVKLGKARTYLMVTGYDYHSGMDYTIFHRTRMYDYAKDSAWSNSNTVVVFDFNTGIRTTWLRASGSAGIQPNSASGGWFPRQTALQGASAPILRQNQGNPGPDTISITHVYRYIENLGNQYPESLQEFCLFSHSWHGPILLNTSERPDYDMGGPFYPLRDPLDTDARFDKDFIKANSFNATRFSAAFTKDSHLQIWGCFAVDFFRHMINAARNAHSDVDILNIPLADRTGASGLEYPDTRAGIHDLFRDDFYENNYMKFLSNAAQRPVWGAPFGCGAMYLSKGSKCYMYIPEYQLSYTNGTISKGERTYKKELEYMRDEMGYEFDSNWYMKYE